MNAEPKYFYNRLNQSLLNSARILGTRNDAISNVAVEWGTAGMNLNSAMNDLLIAMTSGNGVKEATEKVVAGYRGFKAVADSHSAILRDTAIAFEDAAKDLEISLSEDLPA